MGTLLKSLKKMEKDNQISEQVNVSDKGDVLVSLIKDSSVLKLCSRSIKISKAVSLVTAHIEENKELKGKLRSSVLDMTDMAVSVLVEGHGSKVKDSKAVVSRGVALLNFIEIAQSLNLISNTNSTIILQQIKSFLSDFTSFVENMNSDKLMLEDSFFTQSLTEVTEDERVLDIPVAPKVDQKVTEVKQKPFIEKLATANHKAHADSRVTRSSFHPTSAEFRQRLATAKTIEDLHGIKSSGSSNDQSKTTIGGAKNDRQELIISTIGQKGELSIKDLEGVIKGCSEKTIQRELLSLVEQGVLVKSGERRWSRYALAHA